ncbi:MAG TPA: carboxypeptidase-like regulatory domain-containing protein [Actinokineospora sp.]|nr:carboxypeptidase-like regulatory domain-containing protein [Actinokineospora sp.]
MHRLTASLAAITLATGLIGTPAMADTDNLAWVASVSGRVVDDGGDPIPGVALRLTAIAGGAATTATNADGEFTFDALPPGRYALAETQPPGYADGPDTAGSAGGRPGDDEIKGITIGVRTQATGYVFTEDRGSISGAIYDDLDDDGRLDPWGTRDR